MTIRMIIVEDDPTTARYLELGLKRLGYRDLRFATSSEACMALARAEAPDLVLMDIEIEGPRDGIETAQLLRAELDVPVVFLTSHSDESTIARAKSADPLGYLGKPVKMEDLRPTIGLALHRHSAQREATIGNRLLLATMDVATEGMIAADPARTITFANAAAGRMLETDPASLVGRPLAEVLEYEPGGAEGVRCPASLRVADGRVAATLRRVALKDGSGGTAFLFEKSKKPSAAPSLNDEFTGLLNLRGFALIGEHQLRYARRIRGALALLLLRVTNMDELVAEHGANTTTLVVHDMASVLRSVCWEVDTIAILDDWRFAILTPLAQPRSLATHIVAALDAHTTAAGRPFSIVLASAIAKVAADEHATVPTLLAAAEAALLRAAAGLDTQMNERIARHQA